MAPRPNGSKASKFGRRAWRGWRRTLGAGLAALALVALVRVEAPAVFASLRDQTFDAFQHLSPRPYEDAPVRIVDIDEASLKALGQWPWSRDVMAKLTERLQDMGAAAIAYDVVFAEPDRASPHRIEADLVARGLLAEGGTALPDNDALFAQAIARGRTVTGFALTAEANGTAPRVKAGVALLGGAGESGDPADGLRHYPGATANLAILEDAAAGNGNFAIAAADARTVRALPLLAVEGDRIVPSLSLEALRVAQGASSIAVRRTGGTASLEAVAPLTVRVGALEVPLAADGTYALHYTLPAPGRYISAAAILDGRATPDSVAGRIVLVGSSAVGLADLRPTPLNPFEPGVAIHAAGLEQMLLGKALTRPIAAPVLEMLAAVAAGLLVAVLAALAPPFVSIATALVLCGGAAYGALALFAARGLLVDPVPFVVTVFAVFAAAMLARIVLSERDKRRLRHAFGHYLAPDMVEALAAHPERLKLGGELREMTFLFTDLEGFTAFTERCEPQVLVSVLNAYLAEMCAIVTRHGGTIDKIVGDAVHAMFNAPLDQEDHADRAVACALEIAAFSGRFAKDRAAEGRTIGRTRIGVNTGPAVVGNFGGAGRFDYTAHGDAINTAARLEAANKALGTTICIAASTVALCRHSGADSFRPIGTLMLKGKADGVEAFEPVAALPQAPAGWRDAFASLAAVGPDLGAAMRAYAERNPADPIARLHVKRLADNLTGDRIALA